MPPKRARMRPSSTGTPARPSTARSQADADRSTRRSDTGRARTDANRDARAATGRDCGLETFPNPKPDRDYVITHVQPEFTSLCPVTGQPDFGKVTVAYVPDRTCVELKSLKFYFQAFRNEGIFYEDVTNRILDELVDVLAPRWMRITTEWTPRGGMHSTIVAEHGQRT